MRKQLRLSISCASCFLIALLGLPILNLMAPTQMAQPYFGFPLSWLILGVMFFPFVWSIAAVFIQKSTRQENQIAAAWKRTES